MEDGVFYHEHGSWEERIRIEIAQLKNKMKWTLWIGIAIGVLLAFGGGFAGIFAVAVIVGIIEIIMYLQLLYKKQLLKTKRDLKI